MALKIYYAHIDALLEEAYMEKAMTLLPTMRLAKVEKFKQIEDRRRSVAAGVLLEFALLERNIRGKEQNFSKNSDGKPYLTEHPEIYYNLSHSGDYVALVIGDYEVGVDIEGFRENQQKLVKRYFSKVEQEYLEDNWSDSEFTRLWTKKESYIKAVGCGMRGLSDVPGPEYFFESFPIGEKYWLSVCQKGEAVTEMPKEVKLSKMIDELWDLE